MFSCLGQFLPRSMGNCLVLQDKSVNVMKTDEKIIEHKSPIPIKVMSEYSHHHETSDDYKLPEIKHLHPNGEMLEGHLNYVVPLPVAAQPTKKKKTVRFSDDVVEEKRQETGVVRIKVMLSKQELKAMIGEGGVSVEDMISQVQKELIANKIQIIDKDDGNMPSKVWLPALESITEVN